MPLPGPRPVVASFSTLLAVWLSAAPLAALAGKPALVDAAIARLAHEVRYDGSYRALKYPMGDVPSHLGVCTDLVVRAYRAVGVDLQVMVHEDMRKSFRAYPTRWGLTRPDRNIDHRRVPNLRRFLERQQAELPISDNAADYRAGDLVTWLLPGNLPHIGVVSSRTVPGTSRPMIIHNIGAGPVEDDTLFRFPITGHYRFHPYERN